jgi:Cu-Zn family superoxide dismutase
MMNKHSFHMKPIAAAFICGSLFFSGIAVAQVESIQVSFDKLRFMNQGNNHSSVDGMYDNQGTKVPEALVYEGTTYVPIRKISDMLGMPVYWEGSTKTVSIGSASVQLFNTSGEVIGQAVLTQTDKGVNLHVEASQLTPGKHGFHVHEKLVEGNDFKSAGGHFNPQGKKHGHHHTEGHHMGDLSNLVVEPDGTVSADILIEAATLDKESSTSLLGKSLIIHDKEDDDKTDPSGNSGDRIAGGNIPQ